MAGGRGSFDPLRQTKPARLISSDEAVLGSEDGIEFWRGVDSSDVHEMQAGDWLFVPPGWCTWRTPEDSHGDLLYARAGAGDDTTYLDEQEDA